MWAKLFILALLSFLLDTASTNVLFFPRASLYATYDFWRINLPIETRTTWKLASKLEYRIRNFKSSFTTTYFNHHHNMREDLADRIWGKFTLDAELLDHELNATLDVLQHLEQPTLSRSKRSFLPFVGDALSSLFGTATETQLQDIIASINDVSETQGGMLDVIDSTVTVLNQTLVDVNVNRKTINKLTDLVTSLTNRLGFLKDGLQEGYFADSIESDMNVVFTELIAAVKEFRKSVLDMETILSFTENGILPRSLLPPIRLTKILDNIQKSLPPELSLPFDVTDTDSYYANTHTGTKRTPGQILVTLTVPLLSVSDQYNVFQIFNVPVPRLVDNQGYVANYKVEPARFIAISEDQLKFMLTDDHDLHVYLNRKLPFVPLRQPIYNTMTSSLCLPALLTNNTDNIARFCEKMLYVNVTSDPTAHYLGNGLWMVLAPKTINIEIRCKTGQTVKSSHIITTAKPLTLIQLKVGCGGFNSHFQLPFHFQAESLLKPHQVFQLNQTLHLNDVWSHFSSVLTENNVSLHQVIRTLPPVQNGQVTLSAIRTHIHTLQSQAHHYRQTIVISAISVTSLLLCGFAACIGCKCVSRNSGLSLCPSVLLRRYIPDSNPAPGSAVTPQDPTDAATLNDLTRPVSTACPNKDSRPDSTPSPDDTKPPVAHQPDKICLYPGSSRQGVNAATSTGWLR